MGRKWPKSFLARAEGSRMEISLSAQTATWFLILLAGPTPCRCPIPLSAPILCFLRSSCFWTSAYLLAFHLGVWVSSCVLVLVMSPYVGFGKLASHFLTGTKGSLLFCWQKLASVCLWIFGSAIFSPSLVSVSQFGFDQSFVKGYRCYVPFDSWLLIKMTCKIFNNWCEMGIGHQNGYQL